MLPAAFVFCFGGKFVFGGRAFACTAGFFPRFGGSSVARPGGRDDASIVPYKSFAMFAAIGQGFSAAGSGDPALPNVLCSITHYKMLRREWS